MKFPDYPYSRPNMEQYSATFNRLLESFEQAGDGDEQSRVLGEICKVRREFETVFQLAAVRHTIDMNNPMYEAEQQFFNKHKPLYDALVNRFFKLLVRARFRHELEARWGKHLFALAELSVNVVSPEVTDDLEAENQLVSEYNKLLGSAQIRFEGRTCNLSELYPFMISTDRETRRRAGKAKWGFFAENAEQFDEIFDKLVRVRTAIARKLGYRDFVELAYARLLRTDYDARMVAALRSSVEKHLVPLSLELRRWQAARLGITELAYYDEGLEFRTGNPQPRGGAEWIVRQSERMFAEMSQQTREFFSFMLDSQLMDLLTRHGKASGGYCLDFSDYGAPFIFANFTGSSIDVDVLVHESGHAFQYYLSRKFEVPEYRWPTLDACEIHSMSMEFFAWPWMHLFFAEDTDKFKFMHVTTAIHYLCYRAAVDEFQQRVYEQPQVSPGERKRWWRELEKRYLPYKNYDDLEFLQAGGYWQQQLHIYAAPFYFIDYNLAEICAFQFWRRSEKNWPSAWDDYLRLCKAGGSESFLTLVEMANLTSPFAEGCLETFAEEIRPWLTKAEKLLL